MRISVNCIILNENHITLKVKKSSFLFKILNMKYANQKISHSVILFLFLFVITISCNRTKEENNQIKESCIAFDLEYKLIANLNDSNAKVIDIVSQSFEQSNDFSQLKVINNIKKSHKKIEKKLKIIANDNLILIPKATYTLPDSLAANETENIYLLYILKKSIQQEINVLEYIEEKSDNISLRNFASKSKELLLSNQELLSTLLIL